MHDLFAQAELVTPPGKQISLMNEGRCGERLNRVEESDAPCVFICNWIKKRREPRANNVCLFATGLKKGEGRGQTMSR